MKLGSDGHNAHCDTEFERVGKMSSGVAYYELVLNARAAGVDLGIVNLRASIHAAGVAGLSLLAAVALAAGCGRQDEVAIAPEAPPAVDPAVVQPLLALADAADGTEDRVVEKCVTCLLHMDGSAENAHTLGDYTLHFCAAYCRDDFAKDPQKALAALAAP